jgi:hypothetical protein
MSSAAPAEPRQRSSGDVAKKSCGRVNWFTIFRRICAYDTDAGRIAIVAFVSKKNRTRTVPDCSDCNKQGACIMTNPNRRIFLEALALGAGAVAKKAAAV